MLIIQQALMDVNIAGSVYFLFRLVLCALVLGTRVRLIRHLIFTAKMC